MQIRDEAEVERLMPDFFYRQSPDAAWSHYMSAVACLGGVKTFWSMGPYYGTDSYCAIRDALGSSVDFNLVAQGALPLLGHDRLMSWVRCIDGGYLAATSAYLAIKGTESYVSADCRGLAMAGWVSFVASGTQHIMGRWNSSESKVAYRLYRNAAGQVLAGLSESGTAQTHQVASAAVVSLNAWHFVAMTVKPETSLSIMVDGVWVDTTDAPDSIAAATGTYFTVSAEQGGSAPGGFYASGMFVCGQYIEKEVLTALFALSAPAYGQSPRL